ncbi:MAG: hypothetical protein IPP22_05130 [Nitrosomonas sp.]|nr:hypothetical protein [Nitrosomonas sp.]
MSIAEADGLLLPAYPAPDEAAPLAGSSAALGETATAAAHPGAGTSPPPPARPSGTASFTAAIKMNATRNNCNDQVRFGSHFCSRFVFLEWSIFQPGNFWKFCRQRKSFCAS